MLFISDNSAKKWENLLNDITNQEYAIVKSQSLIKKLFESSENLTEEVKIVVQCIYF